MSFIYREQRTFPELSRFLKISFVFTNLSFKDNRDFEDILGDKKDVFKNLGEILTYYGNK